MRDLQTIEIDLQPQHRIDPDDTSHEHQLMIERFRRAWQILPAPVRKGIKQFVNEADRLSDDGKAAEVLQFLNTRRPGRRGFKFVDANLALIRARLREGITVQELRAIVALKARQVERGEFDSKYLRPETLFNRTKCNQYVGELGE